MPAVSEFLGIMIPMYYREHPPHHFQAVYSEVEALISIEDLSPMLPFCRFDSMADSTSSHLPR